MARTRSKMQPPLMRKGQGRDENAAPRQDDAPAPGLEPGPMSARMPNAGPNVLSPPASAPPLPWEDWFQRAAPHQHDEMLLLAGRQGLLYHHQLPAPANGESHHPPPHAENTALARLLAGDVSLLPSFSPDAACGDPELDPAQQEAVARALSTPDFFLLQGLPGSGKTRLAAQILLDTARRGQRILFLAHRPVALDAALLRLTDRSETFVIRYLGPEETSTSLAPSIQAFTLPHRLQTLTEQMEQAAAQLLHRAREAAKKYQDEAADWETLGPISRQISEIKVKLSQVEADLPHLEELVRQEAKDGKGPLALAFMEKEQSRQQKRADAARRKKSDEDQRDQSNTPLADLRREMEGLRPLAEARRRQRWWTWTWWKALFQGDVVGRFTLLEDRERQLQETARSAETSLLELEAKERQDEAKHQQEWQSRVGREVGQRRGIREGERAALLLRLEERERDWQKSIQGLEASFCPPTNSPESLETARHTWLETRTREQEDQKFAQKWAEYLQTSTRDVTGRLPELANVIAAPLDGLPPEHAAGSFDLLLVEDAHLVTEADLLRLGRCAPRWVLIADHQPDAPAAAKKDLPARLRENAPLFRPRCFQKLWQQLHGDPMPAPYSWTREGNNLCCHLRPVAPEEQARLETECLADHPEIQLRILPHPRALLAQVAFPAGTSLAQAKQFIVRELQEVPVQRAGPTVWIQEGPDHLVCHLAAGAGSSNHVPIEIEAGLREWACESHTNRLEFDRSAGWARPQVDAWLQRHLGLKDNGRSLFLGVCHRASPPLAGLLADLFFPGLMLPSGPPVMNGEPAFTFCPVPLPARENGRKADGNSKSPSLPWPREGAGLEIDLTAIRPVDRIPSDLRATLPRKGFANYFEAQAVVRYLEQSLGRNDGQRSLNAHELAVIASYEGQVELIRKLIERSEALKGLQIPLGLPEAFRQREFDTVLVSLTRSHSHRAVALGERPEDLVLALTRACRHIVLFADPGNLIKRAGWQGPLEHLDATSASLEGQRIARLAKYLQGQGSQQEAFRVENP